MAYLQASFRWVTYLNKGAAVKPQLQVRLSQQLTMTPQLQKAIRLLQLSAQELQHEMQLVLESNPMLELDDTQEGQEQNAGTLMDDPETENTYPEYTDPYSSKSGRNTRDETMAPSLEQTLCHEGTLQEYLSWQMAMSNFSPIEREIGSYLIDAINDDGLLSAPFQELLQTIESALSVSRERILGVLKKIQNFDPIGVGARDLKESLLLQLEQLPEKATTTCYAKQILKEHWGCIAKRDFSAVKKKLKLPDEQFSQIMHVIQSLHPRPGTLIGSRISKYILPDLYVTLQNKQWQVALNPLCMPHLRINPIYQHSLSKQSTRDQRYIKQQLQEAQWFIQSIDHRNQTLLSVANYLVSFQAPFLTLGDEALKPLDLTQVANHLSIHESTVSRITMNKTIDTPRGLLELKAFFSNPMNRDKGETLSAKAIRALLKKLIAAEDPLKPLSDARLTQTLQSQGIQVARRTVAKYREALGIPAAFDRKKVF